MPPAGLNAAVGAFLPQGDSPSGQLQIGARVRVAAQTRPLSLRNSDARAIALVVNLLLAAALPGWLSERQRGFVCGRGPLEDIVCLDATARVRTLEAYAEEERRGRPAVAGAGRRGVRDDARTIAAEPVAPLRAPMFPAIILFGFESAFPSIARQYIWDVVARMALPRGVRQILMAMYSPSQMLMGRSGAGARRKITLRTGVPQGCPLSGSMLAVPSQALVALLSLEVDPNDLFVDADDIAMITRSIADVGRIVAMFDTIAAPTSLRLKVSKCRVVPSCFHAGSAEETMSLCRESFGRAAPGWKDMGIVMQARYLGFEVGPSASLADQWPPPLRKYSQCVANVASSSEAPSFVAAQVNAQAAPCLSSVGQPAPADAGLAHAAHVAAQRLLRTAHRSIPVGAEFGIHEAGGPRIRDVLGSFRPSRMQAAMRLEMVAPAAARLREARAQHGPLASLARDVSPAEGAWWAPPAWTDQVAEAAAEGRRLAAGAADAAPPDGAAVGRIVARAGREERHARPLAELLFLRVRKMVDHAEAGDAELRGRFQAALVSLQGVGPCHGAAWMRAICDGWVTGWRRGHGVKACPLCGAAGGDKSGHAMRCPTLWAAVSRVTGVPRPRGALEKVGLAHSAATLGRSRGRGTWPPLRNLRLPSSQVAAACRFGERERRGKVAGSRVEVAAGHVVRRIWPPWCDWVRRCAHIRW